MAKGGVKFKDTVAAYDRLRGEITARKFAPVYLLMGEEAFFIDALCDLLASTILQESERAFNQLTVYGRDSDAGQVVNLCRQMPMMGSYQVVILKEAQQLRGLDKLSLYTSKPSPTTILIVCHKEKNVDKRSQLYKSIAQHGAVLESVRPRDYEIGPWLAQFVASKGCTIDAKAQAMLTDHLGTDLAKISNELGKLLLSLPEGTKKITDAHIEQNIGISKDFNNFELCKAVTEQNLEQALRIADHFARNPKDNPLLVTILALFNQFREIFRINYLRWLSRHKGVPFPSDTELMGILRMNNAYALGELKQTSARWDNRRVFRILGLLREYDAKSKGMNAGGAPDGELLRELLLKILSNNGTHPAAQRYPGADAPHRRHIPLSDASCPGTPPPLARPPHGTAGSQHTRAFRVALGPRPSPAGGRDRRPARRQPSPRRRLFVRTHGLHTGGRPAADPRSGILLRRVCPAVAAARCGCRELRRSLPRIPHLGTRSSLHAGFAGSGDGGQPGGGSGH